MSLAWHADRSAAFKVIGVMGTLAGRFVPSDDGSEVDFAVTDADAAAAACATRTVRSWNRYSDGSGAR